MHKSREVEYRILVVILVPVASHRSAVSASCSVEDLGTTSPESHGRAQRWLHASAAPQPRGKREKQTDEPPLQQRIRMRRGRMRRGRLVKRRHNRAGRTPIKRAKEKRRERRAAEALGQQSATWMRRRPQAGAEAVASGLACLSGTFRSPRGGRPAPLLPGGDCVSEVDMMRRGDSGRFKGAALTLPTPPRRCRPRARRIGMGGRRRAPSAKTVLVRRLRLKGGAPSPASGREPRRRRPARRASPCLWATCRPTRQEGRRGCSPPSLPTFPECALTLLP